MNHSRIYPLLGPAALAYLLVDLVSAGVHDVGWVVGGMALLCSLAPLLVRHEPGRGSGHRRVGALGVALGLALTRAIEPAVLSSTVDLASAIGAAAAGALVLDLAASVPDAPPAFGRPRLLIVLIALLATGLGVAAQLPPIETGDGVLLLPARFAETPALFALGAGFLALALRLLRRRAGSVPAALAANSWAVMGLVPAVLLGAAILLGARSSAPGSALRVLTGLALLTLVTGHLQLVDARRRLQAGRATQRAVAATLAVAVVGVVAGLFYPWLPRTPLSFGLTASLGLVIGGAVYVALAPVVRMALAPWRGRLLEAMERAQANVTSATTLPDMAQAVLPPIRQAVGLDAEPTLYSLDPARTVRIDAAGQPQVRERVMPDALMRHLLQRPGEVIVRAALEGHVVRRPELRPLVDVLVSLDALAVVPLWVFGEPEGALVIPRGKRQSPPSLDELNVMDALGQRLGALISLIASEARARRRAAEEQRALLRADDRLERLQEEIKRVRAEARALRTGMDGVRSDRALVAYSPPMRSLVSRLDELAPLDVPICLVAEEGLRFEPLAERAHARSGRAEGALIVADCSAVSKERTLQSLCGDEDGSVSPGWLRLASGGTLLLHDVPALSLEAQQALAEALACREVRPVGGHAKFPVDVRLVATTRSAPSELADAGVLAPELEPWLSRAALPVAPLRERRDDVPSLILLALDHASRVLGRQSLGIDKDALERLMAHDWPGNEREVYSVIERAAIHAEGPQVRVADLPPLGAARAPAPEAQVADPYDAPFIELERRILSRAMTRAGGNKSEAARSLGLKRTTFLDKLRRHGLDGSTPPPAPTDTPSPSDTVSL